MKSIRFDRFGGPEVLQVIERPEPEVAPGQVLVRVRAAGVNLADSLLRENKYAITPELPAIPGFEVAGTVERVGMGVSELTVGERVAVPLFATGSVHGGYTEFLTIDAGLAVPIPAGLSFEAATALMMQGLTALYLTRQHPPQGKRVLITAAAGGVGCLLVQLAKRAGAKRVIAGASSQSKLALARSLGADAVVDYSQAHWLEPLREACDGDGPDLIYESVGGAVTDACLRGLGANGTLVIYGALNIQRFDFTAAELVRLIFANQSLAGFALPTLLTTAGLRSGLAELFELSVRGELKVEIGGRYPLERAAEAHRALSERRSMGKLVLTA